MYSICSGWMNSELLQMWFYNDFLELVHTKKRTLLLLLDGYSSHINLDMIKMAAKETINFVCPLQHPCFSATGQDLTPLKQDQRQQSTKHLMKNSYKRLTKNCFSEGK